MPKVIQVIQSEVVRGRGVEADPSRMVTQYHALDGEFLAENDPRSWIPEVGIRPISSALFWRMVEKSKVSRADAFPESWLDAELLAENLDLDPR